MQAQHAQCSATVTVAIIAWPAQHGRPDTVTVSGAP